MDRSPFFVPVLTGHAISTLVQAILWSILTIICFLYYSETIVVRYNDITTVESTYTSALETWMYSLYLHKNNYNNIKYKLLNITPDVFITFCSVYFVLSIILINTSIIVIYNLQNMKDKRLNLCPYYIFLIWIFSGLVQSLLDLIFFALLLDDYNSYANQTFVSRHMGVVPTAIGIVMTIVARGFIMWIVNLAMDATSMYMVIQHYRKDDFKTELFPPMERRSPLRCSTRMSEDRRPYPSDRRPSTAGHSNDSFISDRYDQYPNEAPLPPQAVYRSSIVARFNPPSLPTGVTRRSNITDNRFDNGYASDQDRMERYSSSGDVSGMRSDNNLYGGR